MHWQEGLRRRLEKQGCPTMQMSSLGKGEALLIALFLLRAALSNVNFDSRGGGGPRAFPASALF